VSESNAKTILITIDLEDWFQVENLRTHFPHSIWHSCQLRVEESTAKLLEKLAEHHIRATFFILGWTAERVPHLVKQIASSGHEIASHGYRHQLCTSLSERQLEEDLRKSKVLLEDLAGKRVSGYRAPSFSITARLVKLLKKLHFSYDSSFNSFCMHGRYGKLDGSWLPVGPVLLMNESGLYEIPISNVSLFHRTIPWGGGGYFRLYPLSLFNWGVKRILGKKGAFIFYCHPWEFDPGQPRVKGLRPDLGFRHYVNISRNLEKLSSFIRAFSFCSFLTCSEFIHGKSEMCPRNE